MQRPNYIENKNEMYKNENWKLENISVEFNENWVATHLFVGSET